MKFLSYTFLAAVAASGLAVGQNTTPVGYATIECLPNSDTIVGVPFRLSSAAVGSLSEAPAINGDVAVLTILDQSFVDSAYAGTHYVKFRSGDSNGKWYAISSNSSNTITIDLSGDALGADAADSFEVIKFWTLAELFNPAQSTTSASTTGNAIVASANILATGRRTEILLPNTAGVGVNLSSAAIYYVHGGVWKKQGQANTSFNNEQLWPDTYFTIRNPSSVTVSTQYVVSGEVETNRFAVPLATRSNVKQDNFIALPRPVDIRLSDLDLGGTSAFVASTSILALGRRDEVIVFDNGASGLNKSADTIYYYHGGVWKKQGGGNTDFGADIIPAGAGIIVRKYQTGAGETAFWNNDAPY